MAELISANLEIGGRVYPVKVKEDELDAVESIIYDLNKSIQHFKQSYPSKDMQDCISLAFISYAVDREFEKPSDSVDLKKAHDLVDLLLAQ